MSFETSFVANFDCRFLSMHPQGPPSPQLESSLIPVQFNRELRTTVIIPRLEGICMANDICPFGCIAVSIVNLTTLDQARLRSDIQQGYVIGTITPKIRPKR